MIPPAQIAQAFAAISGTLSQGVTASQSNENPHAALVAIIDQVRAFTDQMGAQIAEQGMAAPAPAGPIVWCSQCLGDAMKAREAGQGDREVRPAMTIVGGQAICNVDPHVLVTLTPEAAAAMARGEQVTPSGIVLAGGALPKVGG